MICIAFAVRRKHSCATEVLLVNLCADLTRPQQTCLCCTASRWLCLRYACGCSSATMKAKVCSVPRTTNPAIRQCFYKHHIADSAWINSVLLRSDSLSSSPRSPPQQRHPRPLYQHVTGREMWPRNGGQAFVISVRSGLMKPQRPH